MQRPIIVLNLYKFVGKGVNQQDLLLATMQYLKLVKDYLFSPGKIENWVIICDQTNFSIFGIPMNVYYFL